MRLICTLTDQKQGLEFSEYLNRNGIENQLEVNPNTDWGSPEYGTSTSRVWVIDEDQVEAALAYYKEFLENPNHPRYRQGQAKTIVEPEVTILEAPLKRGKRSFKIPQAAEMRQAMGPVTLYFLVICSLLLLWGNLTQPPFVQVPASLPSAALFSPPVNKTMMYDYPKAYETVDRVVKAYGIKKLQNPEELPEEGKVLLNLYFKTPSWQGFYGKFVSHLRSPQEDWNFDAPMFEKIREGEFWRLFTPVVLHSDIFHLIFNMLWLAALGKQMENKIGGLRYIIFIVIAGVFSNTAQYLMSGSNFIGFSGVLCAFITFVWTRQKIAPWEGYQLAPSTMAFISIFIMLMFTIQLGSFITEVYFNSAFSPGIANTAHLSGALIGWVMGKTQAFRLR